MLQCSVWYKSAYFAGARIVHSRLNAVVLAPQATFDRLCLPPSAMAAAVVQRPASEQPPSASDKIDSEDGAAAGSALTHSEAGETDTGKAGTPCDGPLSVNWMQVRHVLISGCTSFILGHARHAGRRTMPWNSIGGEMSGTDSASTRSAD